MKNDKQIYGGLRELPHDPRDIKFGAIFPIHPAIDFPDEFIVAQPFEMLDQGMTDTCAGHAGVEVAEDEENVPLDPLYQFAKAKQLEGDWTTWGSDIRLIAKSRQQFGSLDRQYAPFTINDPRERWANWNNYPADLDVKAGDHAAESFMFVSGPYDFFDNCRAIMLQNKEKKQTILTGAMWCPEWTPAAGGIVDSVGNPQFGHSVKFFGWKTINAKPYMCVQLSNGVEIGDKGIYYFGRDVVNQSFAQFGGVVFTDFPAGTAKHFSKYGVTANDNFFVHLLKILATLLGIFTHKTSMP